MRNICFSVFAVCFSLFVAACGEAPLSKVKMICGKSDVSATIYKDRLTAVIDGDKIRMNQAESASGAKYQGTADGTEFVLWNKGAEWIMIINDEQVVGCAVQ